MRRSRTYDADSPLRAHIYYFPHLLPQEQRLARQPPVGVVLQQLRQIILQNAFSVATAVSIPRAPARRKPPSLLCSCALALLLHRQREAEQDI